MAHFVYLVARHWYVRKKNTGLLLYVGGVCGYESVKTKFVPLPSCNKDINGNHKFSNKLNESS